MPIHAGLTPAALDDIEANGTDEDFVQAIVRWHFSENTGSQSWLRLRSALPFNPLTDIKSRTDLQLFPDASEVLRGESTRDLRPRGLRDLGYLKIVSSDTTVTETSLPLYLSTVTGYLSSSIGEFRTMPNG